MRAFHGPVRRLLAGAVAAGLLVIAVPAPAAAAASPAVTINDVTVTEGNTGTMNATFTIQVSPHPRNCCSLQVSWATVNGTATTPSDYIASSGTMTLTRTAYSKTITVPVVGDTLDESNETFFVNLSGLVGSPGVIGDAQGVATITDNDPVPLLSVSDVTVPEGDSGTTFVTFTASLSAASGRSATFNWATTLGTATAGVDYVAATDSGTIAAGSTSTTFAVTVNGDTLDENDESFGVTLSAPVNATLGGGSGIATIIDDDPLPQLSIGDAWVVEGDAATTTATFDVTLSPASGRAVTVGWATSDGSATQLSDYVAGSGTLTFAAGDTGKTIDVTVKGDTTAELDETFTVNLSGATNATVNDAQGVGTILDDELEAVIDIDDPTVIEADTGTTTLSFGVTLSNPSGSTVTVDWATSDGTATAGTDYVAASGTLTIPAGDTNGTIDVTVDGDTTYERDETVVLNLSNSTNAPIGNAQGIGTISNDEPAPTVSVGDASVLEGNSGTTVLSFPVSLTGATDLDAHIDFATSDVTASAGTDYVAASGTLTIPAGDTNGTINVTVNDDTTYEPNETLLLTLSNPTDALVGDGTAQGTITNDDKRPTTLTLQVVRKPRAVVAKGLLEPTTSGHRVTVTLFRKQGGKFVKLAAKTARVRYLKDRDGDGKTDGSYTATFLRPRTRGSYKILTRFKGAATYKPRSLGRIFTLAAS
jgi:hypothetical protein